MSGVTVAQIRRSMSSGSTPASASAARAAGRAMSVSASSFAAMRRSRIAVRSWIHSSEVSTICASSSFVRTLLGDVGAEPGDAYADARGRADHLPLHREGQRPACGELVADVSCRLTTADRAADRVDLAVSVSVSPGSTTRLKRQSSIPAKNAILPRFSSWIRTAIAPVWAIASTISTPGITGRSGKWPGNHQSSARTSRPRNDPAPRLELGRPRR